MSDDAKIDAYLKALAKALRSLPERDRDDIVAEIRGHLEHRAGEGKLAEAISALGSADACARSFIDELRIQGAFADGGATRTFGALLALASRRTTATAGLFVSAVFFVLAAGFALTAIAEIVTPEAAGLWISPEKGSFVFGTIDAPKAPTPPGAPPPPRDVLGRWLIPVAVALAVLSFVFGQWASRFFIRLMMRGRRPGAI